MQAMNLPGPKARAIVKRDQDVISPSYPRGYPFVMEHGKGVEVWDVDGNASWIFKLALQWLPPAIAIPKCHQCAGSLRGGELC